MQTLTLQSRMFEEHFAKNRMFISFSVEKEFGNVENFPIKKPYSIWRTMCVSIIFCHQVQFGANPSNPEILREGQVTPHALLCMA